MFGRKLALLSALAAAMLAVAPQAQAQSWVPFCAEGQTCPVDHVRMVRYGGGGSYTYSVTNFLLNCSDGTFGDPAPGVAKRCEFQQTKTETDLYAAIAERDQRLQDLQEQVGELEDELEEAIAELRRFERRNRRR